MLRSIRPKRAGVQLATAYLGNDMRQPIVRHEGRQRRCGNDTVFNSGLQKTGPSAPGSMP